jgi:bacteriocin-like protein
MSNQQDPQDTRPEPKQEPQPADELSDQKLDQVIGGLAPLTPAAPNPIPIPYPITPKT